MVAEARRGAARRAWPLQPAGAGRPGDRQATEQDQRQADPPRRCRPMASAGVRLGCRRGDHPRGSEVPGRGHVLGAASGTASATYRPPAAVKCAGHVVHAFHAGALITVAVPASPCPTASQHRLGADPGEERRDQGEQRSTRAARARAGAAALGCRARALRVRRRPGRARGPDDTDEAGLVGIGRRRPTAASVERRMSARLLGARRPLGSTTRAVVPRGRARAGAAGVLRPLASRAASTTGPRWRAAAAGPGAGVPTVGGPSGASPRVPSLRACRSRSSLDYARSGVFADIMPRVGA